MPRHITLLLLLTLLLVSAGCAPVRTGSDAAAPAELSALQGFSWLADQDEPAADLRLNRPEVRETVHRAVEEALTAKGYVQVERDRADFLVAWFGAIEQKIKKENIDHFYAPYGYGTLYRDPALGSGTERTVLEYEEGTVIIDIVDPASRRLLWRGTGSGRIVEGRPQAEALKNLRRSVRKILEPFPSR